MDPYSELQALLRTGSFTGFRPLERLGGNYFSVSGFQYPLCRNEEGWGPISKYRYDFTPCFIDVWLATVSVYALVLGPVAIWWLLRKKKTLEGASKNAHFYIKQVRIYIIYIAWLNIVRGTFDNC
jgi:hypothetical protein